MNVFRTAVRRPQSYSYGANVNISDQEEIRKEPRLHHGQIETLTYRYKLIILANIIIFFSRTENFEKKMLNKSQTTDFFLGEKKMFQKWQLLVKRTDHFRLTRRSAPLFTLIHELCGYQTFTDTYLLYLRIHTDENQNTIPVNRNRGPKCTTLYK